MSKPHKIKNYSDKTTFFPTRKRYGKLKIILSVAGVAALVFVGISVYSPLMKFLSGNTKPNPIPEPPAQLATIGESIPEPEPLTVPKDEAVAESIVPQKVYGRVLSQEIAADAALLDSFIKELDPEVNTLVLTVKNSQGQVLFNTSNEKAKAWEAVVANPVDVSALTQKLQEKSLNLAVRMSVFSDPIAARGDLENNAIMHTSGVVWIDNTLDNGGKPWTTPYSESARSYNQSLAKELSDSGVSMIILDYMRFPNDPTGSANLKATENVSKAQILNQFYSELSAIVGQNQTKLSASTNLWTIEQKDGNINPSLYGGDPMTLDVALWTVEIDDLSIESENVVKEIYSGVAGKEFIVVTSKDANGQFLIGKEKEYILY